MAGLVSCALASAVSTVNAYIGIGRTLYNLVSSILGSTTVHPAHALDTWEEVTYGMYGWHDDGSLCYFGWRQLARRNRTTGNYHYSTYDRDPYTGAWILAHTSDFWVGDDEGQLARRTYTCVPTPGMPFVYNEWEDFTLCAWSALVTKSGAFPPGEPYESYLRTDVVTLQYNCDDLTFTPINDTVRSSRIDLRDAGVMTLKMPITQRRYAFPMLQWVGKCYDY